MHCNQVVEILAEVSCLKRMQCVMRHS